MEDYITEENYEITKFTEKVIDQRIIRLTEEIVYNEIGLIKSLDELDDQPTAKKRLVKIHNLAKAKRVLMENFYAMDDMQRKAREE
jgi:hypothetical protein